MRLLTHYWKFVHKNKTTGPLQPNQTLDNSLGVVLLAYWNIPEVENTNVQTPLRLLGTYLMSYAFL